MTTHKFGWIPDVPDERDLLFSRRVKAPERVPSSVDLRKWCSPVEDQGDLGSCTAQALVGAIEFLQIKDNAGFTDMSRLFVYYNERVMEGTVRSDAGAYIRDGIKSLVRQGACHESLWPYDITKFAKKPPAACYTEALLHQVTEYQRLLTLDDCRACLALGFPFVFGFSVYESFESKTVEKTGIVPMPRNTERLLGGHAVLAVGYDNAKKALLVRNSWGPSWGIKGYFWLPYGFVTNRNLSDDYWRVTKGEQM